MSDNACKSHSQVQSHCIATTPRCYFIIPSWPNILFEAWKRFPLKRFFRFRRSAYIIMNILVFLIINQGRAPLLGKSTPRAPSCRRCTSSSCSRGCCRDCPHRSSLCACARRWPQRTSGCTSHCLLSVSDGLVLEKFFMHVLHVMRLVAVLVTRRFFLSWRIKRKRLC